MSQCPSEPPWSCWGLCHTWTVSLPHPPRFHGFLVKLRTPYWLSSQSKYHLVLSFQLPQFWNMDQNLPSFDSQADSLLKLLHIIPESECNLFVSRNSLWMPSGQEFPGIAPLEVCEMPPSIWDWMSTLLAIDMKTNAWPFFLSSVLRITLSSLHFHKELLIMAPWTSTGNSLIHS